MSRIDVLLVLVLREAALRSTLVARLAMGGATVWTAQRFDEKLPASIRTPAVLVTDAESVDAHPGGVVALCHDTRWRMVVVLTGDAAPDSQDARLVYIPRSDAAAALARVLETLDREG
jgi:hypothetical protein